MIELNYGYRIKADRQTDGTVYYLLMKAASDNENEISIKFDKLQLALSEYIKQAFLDMAIEFADEDHQFVEAVSHMFYMIRDPIEDLYDLAREYDL